MTDETFELKLRLLDRQGGQPGSRQDSKGVDNRIHRADGGRGWQDGALIGKVDDVDLARADDGGFVVPALLAGPLALGPRLPGRLGRWTVALARRWSDDPEPSPRRIPFERVTELGSAVVLDRSRDQFGIAGLEDWVRTHVIDRIPGSRHASE